ncbi:MAG: hypothetical protein KBF93_15345 [Leptospiraceae bacterium]|nr:hypothetical protein [Leptospiraceae bacterium]
MNKRDFIIFYRSRKAHLETQIEAMKNNFNPAIQKTRMKLKKELNEVLSILEGKKSRLVS